MSAPRLQFGPTPWWNQPPIPMPGQAQYPQQQMLQTGPATMQGQQQGAAPAMGRPDWWNTSMAAGAGQQGQQLAQTAGVGAPAPGTQPLYQSAGQQFMSLAQQQPGSNLTGPNNLLAQEGKTGTGKSGQEQVQNAPKVGEMTLATENAGWTPPNYGADVWRNIAAGLIRNGWGLDPVGAKQNNGIIVGYGSANPITMIMPTDYNYAADTYRAWVAGFGEETAMQRALRWTADEMAGNPNLNPMQVFAKNIRRVDAEARAAGKSSGFNLAQIGGQGTGADAGNQPGTAPPAPAPPAPPAPAPPAPAPPAPPAPAIPPGNGGRYGPAATALAAEDQQAGFDMLWQYLTGSSQFGGGPFDDFLQNWLQPITTSVLNAQDTINGQLPSNMEGVLATLKNGIQGGGDLFGYLNGLGNQAVQKLAGKDSVAFNDLRDMVRMMAPLKTMGRGPLSRSSFSFDQGNALRALQERAYADPTGMLGAGWDDWGTYFQNSPFYQQYYR